MSAKKVLAVVEVSSTGYGVFTEYLPGITGYGKSVDAAKEDFLLAFKEVVETFKEKGEKVPKSYNEGNIEVEYKYDIASFFEHFGMLDATNFAKKIGLNPSLLRQYKTGHALASDKQKKKIEEGLHSLGKELLAVRL